MKILILGYDGYIGYPLTLHLLKKGHEIYGVDDHSRRRRVNELGSDSLTPILPVFERVGYLIRQHKNFIDQSTIQLGSDSPGHIWSLLRHFKPDTIIHLAEQPSAPWSMRSVNFASESQHANVMGTLHLLWAMHEQCPNAHLIKLGTMGEYGTPNCDIPEGEIPEECICGEGVFKKFTNASFPAKLDISYYKFSCPLAGLLFPRTAGSFYHLSKVFDSQNIEFACRNWNLRSTDVMQGVVFGLSDYEEDVELTRFDYDEYFGTAINRFCVQAIIGHPLTVYGKGNQTRGFLPLKDSIQCLTIAAENPPEKGGYHTLNQFENIYSINELADMVCDGAKELNLHAGIKHIPNPRKEAEDHYYNPTHQKLFDLGYKPTTDIQGEITKLIRQVLPYKDRVKKEVILPKTNWR